MNRVDGLILFAGGTLVIALYLLLWQPGTPGTWAQVRVGNETVDEIRLARDQEFTVHGTLGDSVLRVQNGAIRFVDSPCRGKVCIHSGWLQASGEFAACLPNRVTVSIRGRHNDGASGYDSIVF